MPNPEESPNSGNILSLCKTIAADIDPIQLNRYYGASEARKRQRTSSPEQGDARFRFLLDLSVSPSLHRLMKYPIPILEGSEASHWTSEPHSLYRKSTLADSVRS